MGNEAKQYFAGFNEEDYVVGPCETPQEAADQFFDETDAQEAVIGEVIHRPVVVDGLAFIDWMNERIEEDSEEPWGDIIPAAKAEDLGKTLTVILHHWLKRNGMPISRPVIEQMKYVKRGRGR